MSFAEDFGHDIPDYGMDEGTGYGGWRDSKHDPPKKIEVTIVNETDKAWLIQSEPAVWFPKSICVLSKDRTRMTIPCWLYSKNYSKIKTI